MNDSLTRKFAPALPLGHEAAVDPDATDNLGSFGLLRGVRERAIMLTLIKAGGDRLALAYACVDRIEYDPSEQRITLHAAGGKGVRIRGEHLDAAAPGGVTLFDGLARHRVPWVAESGRSERLTAADNRCVVTAIEW